VLIQRRHPRDLDTQRGNQREPQPRQTRLTVPSNQERDPKNNVVAEYALRGYTAPIGLAEWTTAITTALPEEFTPGDSHRHLIVCRECLVQQPISAE
jgi:hypothetical protein